MKVTSRATITRNGITYAHCQIFTDQAGVTCPVCGIAVQPNVGHACSTAEPAPSGLRRMVDAVMAAIAPPAHPDGTLVGEDGRHYATRVEAARAKARVRGIIVEGVERPIEQRQLKMAALRERKART
jgi:hypothetical protein